MSRVIMSAHILIQIPDGLLENRMLMSDTTVNQIVLSRLTSETEAYWRARLSIAFSIADSRSSYFR